MKAKLIVEGKELEVEISEEEYKKLQTREEKKTGYERVEVDEEFYYYISAVGNIQSGDDNYVPIDDKYYDIGNYYSSKVIAENNARADKLMRQMRRFAVEHRENEINWLNISTNKYYINYDFEYNKINISTKSFLRAFGVPYFDSKETAQAAIDKFYDELIWYFTKYKDSL